MNIDNLTFGELKQIASMFSGLSADKSKVDLVNPTIYLRQIASMFSGARAPIASANPVIGQFCIARCFSAGVHAGEVVSVDGENVVLKNSRRLWSWKAKDGVALSGVAQAGLSADKSKVDVVNPTIYLTGVCELIPCSEKAKESINEA